MISDIPSGAEDEEVDERCTRCLGFCSEDTEDRRVDMVLGDTSNIDELLESILVRHVTKWNNDRLSDHRCA